MVRTSSICQLCVRQGLLAVLLPITTIAAPFSNAGQVSQCTDATATQARHNQRRAIHGATVISWTSYLALSAQVSIVTASASADHVSAVRRSVSSCGWADGGLGMTPCTLSPFQSHPCARNPCGCVPHPTSLAKEEHLAFVHLPADLGYPASASELLPEKLKQHRHRREPLLRVQHRWREFNLH